MKQEEPVEGVEDVAGRLAFVIALIVVLVISIRVHGWLWALTVAWFILAVPAGLVALIGTVFLCRIGVLLRAVMLNAVLPSRRKSGPSTHGQVRELLINVGALVALVFLVAVYWFLVANRLLHARWQ